MIARSFPIVVAFLGGCVGTTGLGASFSRGEPPPPTDEGLYLRFGLGLGAGNRRGTLSTAAEYAYRGELHTLGLGMEGGLHLWTPSSFGRRPLGDKAEREQEVLGRVVGGGVMLKARLAASGWSGEEPQFVGEASLGLAWGRTFSAAGPASVGFYLSAFRTSLDQTSDRWSFGLSVAGTGPLDTLWERLK